MVEKEQWQALSSRQSSKRQTSREIAVRLDSGDAAINAHTCWSCSSLTSFGQLAGPHRSRTPIVLASHHRATQLPFGFTVVHWHLRVVDDYRLAHLLASQGVATIFKYSQKL